MLEKYLKEIPSKQWGMQIGPGREVGTRVKFLSIHLPGIKHMQIKKLLWVKNNILIVLYKRKWEMKVKENGQTRQRSHSVVSNSL